MAASPLIAAWAGLRPSHFELAREQSPVPGRPETGPPKTAPATVALVALEVAGRPVPGLVPGPVLGLVPDWSWEPVPGPVLADCK